MSDWNPYHLLLAFSLAGVVLVLLFIWPRRGDRATWDAVTRRLGGKLFEKEGDLRVRFRWHGLDAVLYERPRTALEIAGGEWGKVKLEILPKLMKHDVRDSEAHVDETSLTDTVIASRDLAAARQFLSAPVRGILGELGFAAGLGLSSVRVRIDPGFRVESSEPADPDRLVRFALLGLQLAQHARAFGERDAGVVFEDVKANGGECQICGAALEGTLVSCSRCATPHHRDCWEYAGRCSTYGCGETKASGA